MKYQAGLPEDSWLDSIGPRLGFVYHEDRTGQRTFASLAPGVELTWTGDSWLEAGIEKWRERLRPKDFPCSRARDFAQHGWFVARGSDIFAKLGFELEFNKGTMINLVPPADVEPSLADGFSAEIKLSWRPLDRLQVDTMYLLTEVESREGADKIFDNRIVRSRWNYQFTKEWSLRFIAQREETNAAPLTSLETTENMNYDVPKGFGQPTKGSCSSIRDTCRPHYCHDDCGGR